MNPKLIVLIKIIACVQGFAFGTLGGYLLYSHPVIGCLVFLFGGIYANTLYNLEKL